MCFILTTKTKALLGVKKLLSVLSLFYCLSAFSAVKFDYTEDQQRLNNLVQRAVLLQRYAEPDIPSVPESYRYEELMETGFLNDYFRLLKHCQHFKERDSSIDCHRHLWKYDDNDLGAHIREVLDSVEEYLDYIEAKILDSCPDHSSIEYCLRPAPGIRMTHYLAPLSGMLLLMYGNFPGVRKRKS